VVWDRSAGGTAGKGAPPPEWKVAPLGKRRKNHPSCQLFVNELLIALLHMIKSFVFPDVIAAIAATIAACCVWRVLCLQASIWLTIT
jgi:hypothetical protein